MLDEALRRAEAAERLAAEEQEKARREPARPRESSGPVATAVPSKPEAPPAAPAGIENAHAAPVPSPQPPSPASSGVRLVSLSEEDADAPAPAGQTEDPEADMIPTLEPAPSVAEASGDSAGAAPADTWRQSLDRLRTAARAAAGHDAPEAGRHEPPGFSIAELRLCRKVVGHGRVEAIDPGNLRPGQPVIVYCELDGLSHDRAGGEFRSRLSSRMEIVAAGSGDVAWSRSLGEAEDHAPLPRHDNFVNHRIALPETLPPGEYRIRMTVTDLIAGRTATTEAPVTLAR
ncbi:hypothetical protein [Aquisphaera giovannonii]|nr:hypothetical protein [Aquisphaera giovannonii]